VVNLDKGEINKYFAEDLPYRTGILLAHYKMTRQSWTTKRGPVEWLDCCFVSSLIVGRTYLNMMGIYKSGNVLVPPSPSNSKPDDITFDALGGKLVDVSKLTRDERDLLMGFMVMADKAGAHFTVRKAHPWPRTHEAIEWIHAHLKTNLYDAAGRTGLEPLT
jgi:hypothetical protein